MKLIWAVVVPERAGAIDEPHSTVYDLVKEVDNGKGNKVVQERRAEEPF